MLILVIDPGPHTGVCFADTVAKTWITDTLDCFHEAYDPLWEMFVNPKPDMVVVERFVPFQALSHYGLETIELVGGVRALAYHLKIQLHLRNGGDQAPWDQTARKAVKARLAAQKLTFDPNWHEHQVDALAHMLGFINSLQKQSGVKNMTELNTQALPPAPKAAPTSRSKISGNRRFGRRR